MDHSAFAAKCVDAPPRLLSLALTCCRLDPELRPPFSRLADVLSDEDTVLRASPDDEDHDLVIT